MGQACAMDKSDINHRPSKVKDMMGFGDGSMSMSSYGGPFRVTGLNTMEFKKNYEVGKHNEHMGFVRNNITQAHQYMVKLVKLECPCSDGDKVLEMIRTLQLLDHPNICRCYEGFDDPAFIYLIYQGVETSHLLIDDIKTKHHMSERRAAEVGMDIVRGIACADKAGLAHGALSAKTIRVVDNRCIIMDYGLAGRLQPDPVHKLDKYCLGFVAPEILTPWYKVQPHASIPKTCMKKSPRADDPKIGAGDDKRPTDAAGKPDVHRPVPLAVGSQFPPTTACDIWSLGVILASLLTGKMPFHGRSMAELADAIMREEPHLDRLAKDAHKTDARNVVRKLLSKEPKERPTTLELIHNKWLMPQVGTHCEVVDDNIIKNLVSNQAESEFKKLAMRFVSERLPPAKLKDLESAFRQIDKSGDGFVTLQELKAYLKTHHTAMNASSEDVARNVEDAFAAIDDDGSGVVSLSEFIIATLDTQKQLLESSLWATFKAMDLNHDGKLSKQELLTIMREMGGPGSICQEHIQAVEDRISFEVPDEITFQEFTHIIHEEGGKNKRYAYGVCNLTMKSCSQVARATDGTCRACFKTM